MNLTRNLVALLIGLAFTWMFFFLLPRPFAIAATLLLIVEGWSIANAHKHDTISDIIRILSRKQLLVPWAFGFAFGIGLATGYISDIYVASALAILQGHWFFTLDEYRPEPD